MRRFRVSWKAQAVAENLGLRSRAWTTGMTTRTGLRSIR
jgi:hypothetical protein